jgi:signal transduction histidine kinase
LTVWTPRARSAAAPAGLLISEDDVDRLCPAYVLTDNRHRILGVGSSLRRLTGNSLIGRDLLEVFRCETSDESRASMQGLTLLAEKPRPLTLRGVSLDQGENVWLLVGHDPQAEGAGDLGPEDFGPCGASGQMLATARENADLLARSRALSEALAEQKLAAEAANRAKSTFLATMSHEIRTPMNGVLGLAGLLGQTKLDDEQRELLEVIVSSGQALMDILNDVLDLSKVESGRTELECVGFSLQELLSSLEAMFRPQASSKGVELVVESTAPPSVTGDPSRVRQILLNLIGNAIKFTDAGVVAVRAAYRARGPRGGRLKRRRQTVSVDRRRLCP